VLQALELFGPNGVQGAKQDSRTSYEQIRSTTDHPDCKKDSLGKTLPESERFQSCRATNTDDDLLRTKAEDAFLRRATQCPNV
jgi:hypothetical protein